LEEEFDSMQREMQEVQEEAAKKAQVLQEKQDIIDMVMLEVEKIRDQQDSDKRNTQEKDAVIEEMANQIEMLTRQSDTKGEEIRTLIDKMEAYKRQKDQEVLKIRKKLQ
jgi:phage-related tail protein